MCILIDTCVISSVFDRENKDHNKFEPVLDWIKNGNGKMVYGGTKYGNELAKMGKYLQAINNLRSKRKLIKISDKEVDAIENDLITKYSNADFDDQHLAAIIIATKIRLICTNDRRAISYLKDKKIYPSKVKKPKLYTGLKSSGLLTDENIVGICTKDPGKLT